jgi:6-phosphogluconolactonase
MYLYTGGYTKAPNGRSKGIGLVRFDPATGQITPVEGVAEIINPSFLAATADGQYLYAVTEGDGEGNIAAYRRDPATGALTELNRQSSRGNGPCYVAVDHSGRYVLAANYGSGSIAALPIQADGSLGEATGAVQQEGSSVNPERQEGPHAHMIASSPEGNFVYATDLGADRVFGYRLDLDSGKLIAVPEAGATADPGAGPRHFAFSPDARTMYVINELGYTLTSYAYDAATGALTPRQTVPTLPEDYDGPNLCAHVVVSPDGRFVYGSNRFHDTIAIWEVAAETGELSLVERVTSGGKTPRNFAISPDAAGSWLLVANMDSDNVVVWPRDSESGLPVGEGVSYDIPSCSCLLFLDD